MWGKRKNKTPKQYDFLTRTRSRINSIGLKISIWLSSKTAHLSRKQILVYFFVFGSLFFLYNVYLVAKGVHEYGRKTDTLTVNIEPLSIDTVHHFFKHRSLPVFDSSSFNKYFDSINTNPTIRDSLLKHRPGLIDSLLQIKKYYNMQLK